MTSQHIANMVEESFLKLHTVARMSHGIESPLRWVDCDECGGYYQRTRTGGEVPNHGQGPTWMPVEYDWECQHCTEGYVQVDEGDGRWDEGTFAHPNE